MGMFGFDDQSMMFDVTPVENQFILEHMLSASGDYVKVYLYGLMYCYRPAPEMSPAQMAHDLQMSQDEVLAAYRYWERRGLVKRVSDDPPTYRYVNVKQHAMLGVSAQADPAYEAFAESVYALFGNDRRIHGGEMMQCYEWVEELQLPPEVVILLLQHVMDQRGKQFTIKAAQKVAAMLAQENARTIDDAEQVLNRDKQVWEGSKAILRRMNKRRMPTQDEMELYLKWYRDWGFGPEAILEACAQMTRGDPSFAYLDGILRGIKGRQGAVASGAQMVQALQSDKDRAEPLKQLLAILGLRDQTVNEASLAVYDQLRAMYDDEVIRLAGRECAARGGRLDSVMSLLEAWQARGLTGLQQVQEHLERVRKQDAVLRRIYQVWSLQCSPSNADRTLLSRWMGDHGMTEDFILHCAPWATGTARPMAYLDGILKDLAEKGIRTPEAADAAHAQRKPADPPARGPKQVREQQYTQREYTASTGMPDWMKEMMAEEGEG